MDDPLDERVAMLEHDLTQLQELIEELIKRVEFLENTNES